VEQLFSKLKRSPAELASAKEDTDRRLAIVMGDSAAESAADKDDIVRRARAHYAAMTSSKQSARTRVRGKTRIDKGIARVARAQGTDAEWQRKRSQAVQEAGNAAANQCTTPLKRTKRELPESLAKEVQRQGRLSLKRKAEAALDGLLLETEISKNTEDRAAKKLKQDASNDLKRAKVAASKASRFNTTKMRPASWALKALPRVAYIAHNVAAADGDRWRQRLFTEGVDRFTQDRHGFCLAYVVSCSAILGSGC
jgi:hypothetical protein